MIRPTFSTTDSPRPGLVAAIGVTIVTLGMGCAPTQSEEPRTPRPMNADGSGPSYSGPGTPWQDPDLSKREAPEDGTEVAGTVAQSERRAKSSLIAAPGYRLGGTASLTEIREGVKVHVVVEGAPPGTKGIHIHQTDNCTDIPNKSMGSHFSPEKHEHGLPGDAERHLGDLGNIEIAQDGSGVLEIIVPGANLKAVDARSFVGRSIVLHEARDEGTGDSGNAGKPIACGPIG